MGWDSVVGEWSRVEGHSTDPDPNDPYGMYVYVVMVSCVLCVAWCNVVHIFSEVYIA